MRRVLVIALSLLVTLLFVQVYGLYVKKVALKNNLGKINSEIEKLGTENQNLTADLEYFADPLNLAKEFKSKFNYKKPGEKLIIVVPNE